jgi:hypothetical protein
MNPRQTQDVILRLLADAPFRAAAMDDPAAGGADVAAVARGVDMAALDRFGRFLCRHYYRERVVHYFKYSRALAPMTGRPPEGALKTEEFRALMPTLILGAQASARAVCDLLRDYLGRDAEAIRAAVPFWDDLVAYQSAFFLSDALPAAAASRPFPARAETATLLELAWDLPAVLPELLRPFDQLHIPARQPTRLLFSRSPEGEVTVLRCNDALRDLLEGLTGDVDPAELAARMGLDAASIGKTLHQLERLGAIIARGSFSSSHVGSDLRNANATRQ